ncbi:ribonuclease H-like domain-containing protein [Tanacetum coccineum]
MDQDSVHMVAALKVPMLKPGDTLQGSLGLRNQENRNRENTRRVVPVETTTSNALVSCNGSGYDWSDQAEKVDKCKTGLGYNAVPPPYTGKFMPPKPDLSFSGLEELHVVPIVPRKNNMYSVDLKNIVPKGGLTCLFSKATSDESELWHRRLGHINFKTMNKLVKGNLDDYRSFVGEIRLIGIPVQKHCDDAGKARMKTVPGKDYILLPLWTADPPFSQSSKSSQDDGSKPLIDDDKKVDEDPEKIVNVVGGKISIELPDDLNMPTLEEIVYLDNVEDVGAEANMNNLDTSIPISPILTTRVHKDHLVEQIIGDLNLAPQTRRMTKNLEEHGLFSSVQQRTNHKGLSNNCCIASFLSQVEPKKIIQAL